MDARINGKRVPFSTVEIRIGGESCRPRPLGYVAVAEEYDSRQQLQDDAHFEDLVDKRAARKKLRAWSSIATARYNQRQRAKKG